MSTLSRQAAPAVAFLGIVAAIGVLAWRSPIESLLVLLLPAIMRQPLGRWWPLLVALAYFGGGNAELPGLMARLEMGLSGWMRWGLAVALTVLQAAPFALVHMGGDGLARAGRMLLALALLTVPPIGLLAWRNPLLVAGMLFPGTGWGGVLLVALVFAVLLAGVRRDRGMRWVGALLVVALVGAQTRAVLSPAPQTAPGLWPIPTNVAPAHARDPLDWREPPVMAEVGPIVEDALRLGARVVVLPESILQPATLADEAILRRIDEAARARQATVLVGQSLPLGAGGWRNAIVAYGRVQGVVDESRVPVPVGNWRLREGVPLRPWASDTLTLPVGDRTIRVGMSICYEDLLLWPHRGLLLGRADALVSVANAWAVEGSMAERAQDTSAVLLSRLSGVPLVRAKNHWREGW